MKLYIAGPMTGLPEFNYPAFRAAAKELETRGYEVSDPSTVEPRELNPTWVDYMRLALTMMLTCDGVALLPGWDQSKEATTEADLAHRLEMPVLLVDEWKAAS